MRQTFPGLRQLHRQRGVAGMMAMLFLLVVVGFSAVTLLNMSSSDLHDTTAQNDSVAALFAAETGIERASQLYSTGTPCSAALLPPPAPAAAMPLGTRASFQSTTFVPMPLAGPTRCRLQVIGRVGNTTRTVQAELAGLGGTVTFEAATNSTANNAVSTLSWPHTIPATAGTDRALVVGVSIHRAATEQVLLVPPASAPSYGGQPLTSIGAMTHPSPTGELRVEMFLLVNPTIGTANITLNLSASTRVQAGAVTLSGVDPTLPVDAGPLFRNGTDTVPTVSLATLTNNAWVVDTMGSRMNANATVGGGQTEHWNRNTGGGPPAAINGTGSTEPKAVAGPVTMNWTLSAAQPWVTGAVALRPGGRVYVMNWQER